MNETIYSHPFESGVRLEIARGDITHEQVDAIVNAANDHLRHGGGVALAIARAGGPQVQQESDAWVARHGLVRHDRPAYTSGGKLPVRRIIHAVGPVWGSGQEEDKLAAAVRSSLHLADELGLQSIALPAISTGIYGFPAHLAAHVIVGEIARFAQGNPQSLQLVRIVLFDQPALQTFVKASHDLFGA